MTDISPNWINVEWNVPKCDGSFPVVDYNVTVVSSGGSKHVMHFIPAICLMNASPSSVSLNVSNDLECPNNKSSFNFLLEPCTDNIIYIQPVYNQEWSTNAVNTVAWTARSIDDQVSNFSAKWNNDLLVLGWSGLNCIHNLDGWNLTDMSNNTSVLIPLSCSLLKDSTGNHQIRIKKNNTVICNDDIPHWDQSLLVHIQACVVYRFSLFPVWKEKNTNDLIVQATAQPLLKSKILFDIFMLNLKNQILHKFNHIIHIFVSPWKTRKNARQTFSYR